MLLLTFCALCLRIIERYLALHHARNTLTAAPFAQRYFLFRDLSTLCATTRPIRRLGFEAKTQLSFRIELPGAVGLWMTRPQKTL
jgi:hypothetical protein